MTGANGLRLAILHHLPLEFYPPAENLLQYLAQQPQVQTLLITTPADAGGEAIACSDRGEQGFKANVLRLKAADAQDGPLRRLLKTLRWHMSAAAALLRFRPDVLIVTETHSALAAWVYRVLYRGKAKVVLQHYEYNSPRDFHRPGNRLLRLNRFFEQLLFRSAVRITQTNPDRLRLFHADNPELRSEQLAVWPNYPPAAWLKQEKRPWPIDPGGPLRLVMVGAVSLKDTWIGSLAEWITHSGQEHCTLDVYCSRCDGETAAYLQSRQGVRLRFHKQGVPYSRLPERLAEFDVGLILYRGSTTNFIWNETNKLFEYLSCGLDVWYPPCMKSIAAKATNSHAPRVLETDFEKLAELDFESRRFRSDLPWVPWTTGCEQVFEEMLASLINIPRISR